MARCFAGLVVSEVPSHERLRIHGVSNLNAVSDGIRVLRTIMAERRRASRVQLPPVVLEGDSYRVGTARQGVAESA